MASRSSPFIDYRFDWFPDPLVVAEETDLMATELADIREPLQESVLGITRDVQRRFDTAGDGSWAPWAVVGQEGPAGPYARTYFGEEGILRRDEKLYKHAGNETSYIVGLNTITYEPLRDPADIVLQQGSEVRNIYDRPFMGLDEAGITSVVETFEFWLDGIMGMQRVPMGQRIEGISGVGVRFRDIKTGRFTKA